MALATGGNVGIAGAGAGADAAAGPALVPKISSKLVPFVLAAVGGGGNAALAGEGIAEDCVV